MDSQKKRSKLQQPSLTSLLVSTFLPSEMEWFALSRKEEDAWSSIWRVGLERDSCSVGKPVLTVSCGYIMIIEFWFFICHRNLFGTRVDLCLTWSAWFSSPLTTSAAPSRSFPTEPVNDKCMSKKTLCNFCAKQTVQFKTHLTRPSTPFFSKIAPQSASPAWKL